jgi:basic amino acid/polyamine antiporter, APA family
MPQTSGEPRELGFWTCTALVVGNTIGVGIFVLPASLAPFGLNALSAWGVTIVGCLFLAIVFAGLARAFPRDDGAYAYVQRAFGPHSAFLILWCYLVSCWITNAVLAIGVVAYLSALIPSLATNRGFALVTALALVWLFVLINLRGARAAGWVQLVMTVVKLLPLFGIIVLGLWQLGVHPAKYVANLPPTPASWHDLIAASTIALYAMLGIESATIPAGKVKDPARTIPRSTIVGTLLTAFVYLGICAIPVLLIPQHELASSDAPFALLFQRLVGGQFGQLLALCVVVSGLGCLNGWTLICGDLARAMAVRGSLPAVLARTDARSVPTYALLLTGVLPSLMLVMNYNDSMAGVFTFLSVMVTAANMPLYLACAIAVWILWRRGERAAPGARDFIWLAAALLTIAYSIWIFLGMGAKPLLWAIVLGIAGIPVHWCSLHWRRRRLLAETP